MSTTTAVTTTATTTPRLDLGEHFPAGAKAMAALERSVRASSIDRRLLHLVKLRASMLNGCAYCVDMHWKDARRAGESEQRLYGLWTWAEVPWYDDRERAAFALTDAVTRVAETHVPDDVYDEARAQFSDDELAELVVAISTINSWNRIAISTRMVPGSYEPA
jgi:AhpD family alkylhydroperoxidase